MEKIIEVSNKYRNLINPNQPVKALKINEIRIDLSQINKYEKDRNK